MQTDGFRKKSQNWKLRAFSHRPSQNLEFSWKKLAFCWKQLASSWKSLAFWWKKTAFYWNDLVFVGNWVGMHRVIRFFWDFLNSKANPMGFQCFPIQIHPISSSKIVPKGAKVLRDRPKIAKLKKQQERNHTGKMPESLSSS